MKVKAVVKKVNTLSVATENMIIAAWSMGIGSAWLEVPLLPRG